MACNQVKDPSIVNEYPKIYPDYIGVTIPDGIAPLNFNYAGRNSFNRVDVTVEGSKSGKLHVCGDYAKFDIDEWHNIVKVNKGGSLKFTVCVESDGKWVQYKSFSIFVSKYDIDEYGLTYRKIAPGYEIFSKMGIYQRDLSNFDESSILENTQVTGMCINCHSSNRTNPDQFTFHVRGKNGATLVQINGKREWMTTKIDTTLRIGSCVYPYWHPSGKYIAYSTNTTRQGFHAVPKERIEVFDFASDVMVYRPDTHELLLSPLLMTKEYSETYPTFSPDGHTLYFCTCKTQKYPQGYKLSRYNLCKIAFNPENGTFGDHVDTLLNMAAKGKSLAFPRPSYDGKYIMFTLADYGTFPIWHREADLWLLSLRDQSIRPLSEVNSKNTESFHNWNTNSHWFVFSSRRDDGLYTRLYLSSIDDKGHATKPFLLPQENPWEYYNESMYSYNVPDFTKTKVKLDAKNAGTEISSNKRVKFIEIKR